MKRTETTDGGHSCPPREVGTIPTEIGMIAADWRIAPLDAVCEPPQYGFTASAEAKGNVRFLRITDITDSGVKWPTVPFCECPEKELGKYRLAPGDIVFARIGATTGKSYLITNPPPSVFASYLIRVRAKREIYPEFLSQFFRSDAYWRQVDAQKNANLKKGVSGSVLKTLLVPVPPLPEQRKIAGVLGVVQRAIEQQERVLALTAELKKAFLHKLFTEGLRGEPQKQTDIGPVPESWDIRALGDHLTEAQYGISIKGAETGRYPVLRMTNQKQGQISGANLQYVDLSPVQLEKFRVDRQDILFNRTNSLELVGRTAIFDLEGDFVFASYLIRLRTDAARIRPFFLNHYFNWDETQVRLKSIATRAVSQSNISATRLKGFPVPVPSPEEQDKIVTRIDCVDRKRSVHQRKHAVLTALFRTLLHQLMTAQIRVQEIDLEGLLAQPVAQMDSKS
jgi:type I restriction enzyme S subunit